MDCNTWKILDIQSHKNVSLFVMWCFVMLVFIFASSCYIVLLGNTVCFFNKLNPYFISLVRDRNTHTQTHLLAVDDLSLTILTTLTASILFKWLFNYFFFFNIHSFILYTLHVMFRHFFHLLSLSWFSWIFSFRQFPGSFAALYILVLISILMCSLLHIVLFTHPAALYIIGYSCFYIWVVWCLNSWFR